jgi:hypothetical protein
MVVSKLDLLVKHAHQQQPAFLLQIECQRG